MSSPGQSLELFFIDGKPDGMLTAELFNWTGHVLAVPRTQISDALRRREATYTGVYILVGEDDDGGPRAYIGEAEDIGARIRNHDTKQDWWTAAILVTTSANNLNKAHVKYLEARLVEEAVRIGLVNLSNGNTPPRSSLSEAAQSNMEAFLENLLMVLPAIRIDFFLERRRPSRSVPQHQPALRVEDHTFELRTPKHGLTAQAKLNDGEFIVQAGSKARLSWEGTPTHAYRRLFDELVASGILEIQGRYRVFTENYAFKSPSAAGAVINGRATNGQEAWRVSGNTAKSYREWEEENLIYF